MTPDQQLARLVKFSMVGFVLVFAYFMLADLEMPLTPQAMATRTVVKIAPQVSGPVQSVAVANNQHVEAGQLLFAIDPAPFELALEQAKLALEQAMQDNAELDAAIEAARADVSANEAMLQQKQREARRLDALYASNGVSRQLKDQADTDASSALAKLAASKAQLAKLKVSRGTAGTENLKLRQARSRLAQAELDLSYTKVLAENEGIVTNLQLASGSMANKGQPVLALVSEQLDIIADFREKTLRGVEPGTEAWVAFDAEPGRLYPARVSSRDAGVSAGQFDANGMLATPTESDRWVRDAQRLRLHFELLGEEHPMLAAGSRATVQLLPDNSFYRFMAKLQIKAISLLHYIY
ncbi:HlyD family secretion protein [Shewanella algae]|uniref:HlyD family secretion protein n=1 Tax=Shewanella algae TaxID=38313 RepID=UPI003AAF1C21